MKKPTRNNTRLEDTGGIDCTDESKLHVIKRGRSEWRQREITLYEHPVKPDRVISIGVDSNIRVICDDLKSDWARELSGDYDSVSRPGYFVTK